MACRRRAALLRLARAGCAGTGHNPNRAAVARPLHCDSAVWLGDVRTALVQRRRPLRGVRTDHGQAVTLGTRRRRRTHASLAADQPRDLHTAAWNGRLPQRADRIDGLRRLLELRPLGTLDPRQRHSRRAHHTLGLLAFIAAVLTTYLAACWAACRLTNTPGCALPGLFLHSLVPIALGYVTAHYLTLLILEGQRVLITSSDPLSRGWDLFGTTERGVDASITNYPGLIGSIQAGAVVAGHITAPSSCSPAGPP